MNKTTSLTDLIAAVTAHEGSWGSSRMDWDAEANAYLLSRNDSKLAWDVDFFLWATYDPEDNFIYPNIESRWDDLLEQTMGDDSYSKLGKDEVLSILFGLHHRTRVQDGLWTLMFERGVTQKLLGRLLALDTDKC
jgi:hypothetical protein